MEDIHPTTEQQDTPDLPFNPDLVEALSLYDLIDEDMNYPNWA